MSSVEYTDAASASGSGAPPPPSYKQAVQHSFKLSFVDFVPQCTNPDAILSSPQFERFDVLVCHANSWLSNHPDIRVKTCESIEVKVSHSSGLAVNTDKPIFWESGKIRTMFIRALRLWIIPRDPNEPPEPQQISYINVVPACQDPGGIFSHPRFDSFGETLNKFNKMLRHQPIPGRILTVESQEMKFRNWNDGVDPDKSSWLQSGDFTTSFLFVIRVFYEVGQPLYEEIGCADFVPLCTDPGGVFSPSLFEHFGQVMNKASIWTEAQHGIRVTNVQSVDIKMHASWGGGEIDTQRVFFSESGHVATHYIRIIRVCYTRIFATVSTISHNRPITLNYKTFYPLPLTTGGVIGVPTFETQSQTMKRAIAWLNATGVKIVSAETVPIRMCTGNQYGQAEQTYTWNRADCSEYWLYILRVYVDGHYQEPPPELLPPPPEVQPADDCCCRVM